MATARDIVNRALRRIRETGSGETPSADQALDALSILNAMMASWPSYSVDTLAVPFVLADTFAFFVPPKAATAEVIAAINYRGTWDADANTPALATGTGTLGYAYKVSTAGSTTLDDVTSWAVNDYAVFDGSVWLKSISSLQIEQAVIDMLAFRLCQEFGQDPGATVQASYRGWNQIMAAYIKPQTAGWDAALTRTYARPYTFGGLQ